MNNRGFSLWDQFQEKWLSRRGLIRGAAGTMLGADFFRPKVVHASDDDGEEEQSACVGPSPIPGGAVGLKPYGIFIHHNPLNPAKRWPTSAIRRRSQISTGLWASRTYAAAGWERTLPVEP